jgi:hypothetical protein
MMDSMSSTESHDPKPKHAPVGYFCVDIFKKRILNNTFTIVSGSDPVLFLLNVLSNMTVYWEKPALVVLSDIDVETTYLRLLSIISGIHTSDILSRQISPNCFASLDDGATDLYYAPAYFWCPQNLAVKDLERETLKSFDKHGNMSLFIDTVEKLTPSYAQSQSGSMCQRVCDQLREFAEAHNIPVIAGVGRIEVGDLTHFADLVVDVEHQGGEATIRVAGRINEEEESVVRFLECCGRYVEKQYRPWGDRFEKETEHRRGIPNNAHSISTNATR